MLEFWLWNDCEAIRILKWGLCRAFLAEPRVLFLDEPTVGLDPITARDVRKHIAGLAREKGITVFMNTHNLDEAVRLCGKVAVIDNGGLVACEAPRQLRSAKAQFVVRYGGEPVTQKDMVPLGFKVLECEPGLVRLNSGKDGNVPALVRFLVEGGRDIHEVAPATNPLEDIIAGLLEEPEKANEGDPV